MFDRVFCGFRVIDRDKGYRKVFVTLAALDDRNEGIEPI